MVVLTLESLPRFLRDRLRLPDGESVAVRELAGGVSNAVFLAELARPGERFVVKQAREKLRVQEEWRCSVERIWREVDVLRMCGELLGARNAERGARSGAAVEYEATVPRVLWEDRENYCYAMSAALDGHRTWKELLLAGELAESGPIAAACGRLLGTLHAGSWNHHEIAARLDDRVYFDQLRLDPYYRQVARVQTDLQPQIERLIESVWTHRRCLVHGDFSPKNLLVWPGHVMLIDFEVGHYGDPAFDLGFFLTHLALKSIWSGLRSAEYANLAVTFWNAYQQLLAPVIGSVEWSELERRMLWNLAGCLLARIDGKSPVDYLTRAQQNHVRRLARDWMATPPVSFAAAAATLTP
jgi:5-methylthioribose kinase